MNRSLLTAYCLLLDCLLFLPMKIGVQLPEIEYEASWKQVAAMARLAEEVGLDSIWLGDHLLYDLPEGRRGPWEAWSMLAALAAVTERVELGPLVAALPFHNPAVLAKKAATVDEISGGRLILGVGAGWNQVEFEAFGLPYDRRIARFAEAFTIVRTLLSEGRIDFRGEFYTLVDCELLPRPIPTWRPTPPDRFQRSPDAGPDPAVCRCLELVVLGFRQRSGPRGSADRDDRCRVPSRQVARPKRSPRPWRSTSVSATRPAGAPVAVLWSARSMRSPPTSRDVAAAGVSHIQAVLDPIVPESIEKLGEISARLRDGS